MFKEAKDLPEVLREDLRDIQELQDQLELEDIKVQLVDHRLIYYHQRLEYQ